MGRKKRIWCPDYFYHVISRGNRRDALFLSDRDFRQFLNILELVSEQTSFKLAAYCLMTNHYHLLLKTSTVSLSSVMRRINKRYASYFNNHYHLTGHVFEERFFSSQVANSMDMVKASRYIHLNPVRAEMVENPEDYQWSSFRLYLTSKNSPPFLTLSPVLELFSGNESMKRKSYCEIVQNGIDIDDIAGKL